MKVNDAKRLSEEKISDQLADEHHKMAVQSDKAVIDFFNEQIDRIENAVLKEVKLRYPYEELLTVPGIGKILGITIMLETGDINRFPTVSDYSSYCRCVSSKKISNGKKKGEGNKKRTGINIWRGHMWKQRIPIFMRTSFMRRYSEPARSWHQRKESKTNQIVAIKALSNKIAKACYFIIKDQKPFDPKKLFQ